MGNKFTVVFRFHRCIQVVMLFCEVNPTPFTKVYDRTGVWNIAYEYKASRVVHTQFTYPGLLSTVNQSE